LRITHRLRIVQTAKEFGPAVLGVLRPVLVLPVSMLTGLPPDVLRAIVAHELAHIRRWDYLLNMVQMLIEAVLFFNPAVWWINRQIRIEREACCDAMAARVLGQPLVVAKSLALWAERMVAQRTTSAMAFAEQLPSPSGRGAGGEDGSTKDTPNTNRPRLLLDRILRIVMPGYRPPTRFSPLGSLGLLFAGFVLLAALSCGTSAVVDIAAKALTPAERMERIVETQKKYAAPEVIEPQGKFTISGKIRTFDGKPARNVRTDTIVHSGITTSHNYNGVQSSNFSITQHVGKTWLHFTSEGYAPAILGPFNGKAGEKISDIEVVLERGFPLTVRIIDEKGKPIEGATLRNYPVVGDGSVSYIDKVGTSDSKGIVVISHAAQRKYDFSVQKPGYQPLSVKQMAVKPDTPITFTLAHAKPLRGVVLSPDGNQVVGAEIREYAKFITGGSFLAGKSGRVSAVTDAQGRFVLDELEDNATYALLVVSKQYGRQLVQDVNNSDKELRIKMGPNLVVSGTILGDLNNLAKENGKSTIQYGQDISFPDHYSSNCDGGNVPVAVKDGKGEFAVQGLLPGEVTITAGEHVVRIALTPSQPSQQVTIDLTKPVVKLQLRKVIMRFATPDGAVPPEGTIRVAALENERDQACHSKIVSLKNGEARFEAYAPGPLSYEPEAFLGYWFENVHIPRIEPSKEPLEITVPVIPAGAVAGQVLNADGTPATENVSISVDGKFASPKSTRTGGFGQCNITADALGKFFVSPLPLGGKYTVKAQRRHNVQLSSAIRPDAAHPTVNVTIQLPPTDAVEGRVLDPEGHPMARLAFGLSFSPPKGGGDCSWIGDLATDCEGRFRIDDLSVGFGHYSLTFTPRHDFSPLRVPLALNGKPITVRLQRGLMLEGQVLDEATGRPIAGVEVYAMPQPYSAGGMMCEAEGPTDREGRFRFSNLEDRTYQFNPRDAASVKIPDADKIRRPGPQPLVIRMTLAKGSRLKPQPVK
jgi:hypothetical protein